MATQKNREPKSQPLEAIKKRGALEEEVVKIVKSPSQENKGQGFYVAPPRFGGGNVTVMVPTLTDYNKLFLLL